MTSKSPNKKESKAEESLDDLATYRKMARRQSRTSQLGLAFWEEFQMKITEKDKEITKLKETVSALNGNIMKLEVWLEDADAYERTLTEKRILQCFFRLANGSTWNLLLSEPA